MNRMIRPDWEEIARWADSGSNAYIACNCGTILQTLEMLREHWQRGCFDRVEWIVEKNGEE